MVEGVPPASDRSSARWPISSVGQHSIASRRRRQLHVPDEAEHRGDRARRGRDAGDSDDRAARQRARRVRSRSSRRTARRATRSWSSCRACRTSRARRTIIGNTARPRDQAGRGRTGARRGDAARVARRPGAGRHGSRARRSTSRRRCHQCVSTWCARRRPSPAATCATRGRRSTNTTRRR